ncbi:MAG: DUF305 domain-containing protein [Anaerolineae bacterium]|nr:DUF305 domain-containing protein [Anaerolineae bacterium]
MNQYAKFGIMIATSTLVMFGLMYLNTYALDHVIFSETRAFMALVMGAAMALIMLLFNRKMYTNRRANTGIIAASIFVFVLALGLVRSQATVTDVAWMKAMIPHHSIAILTSERANISDPRVRDLADRIITAQRSEIEEMKRLIADIEGGQ